jgi:uncharacterized membrane protein SirB2
MTTTQLAAYYPDIKLIHVTTVLLTGSLFLLRFIWMQQGTLRQRGRWVRTLPDINDSVLLISGLSLAILIGQYPLQWPWLTAKLITLIAYILFGAYALRHGKTLRRRRWSGYAAIACYLYIVSIALTHSPLPTVGALMLRLGL